MTNKILVAYATAAGSTGGVAEMIGKTLAETGLGVDVRPVQSVAHLDDYDAIVLGSAIHGGRWLPQAVEFLQANQNRLNQVPTAFFLVGLMANKKSEGDRKGDSEKMGNQPGFYCPFNFPRRLKVQKSYPASP